MKISPYIVYLEMQPDAQLVRQNFIICKKWVLQRTKQNPYEALTHGCKKKIRQLAWQSCNGERTVGTCRGCMQALKCDPAICVVDLVKANGSEAHRP
jgi:hypothetical protein